MQGAMPGARRRGRPRTGWMENTKTWTGLSVEESIRMTEDRERRPTSMVWPTLGSRMAEKQNKTVRGLVPVNAKAAFPARHYVLIVVGDASQEVVGGRLYVCSERELSDDACAHVAEVFPRLEKPDDAHVARVLRQPLKPSVIPAHHIAAVYRHTGRYRRSKQYTRLPSVGFRS